MSTAATFADVSEAVRAVISVYTQALDDGRTDDVVATFCTDGACEMPGLGVHRGHDALHAFYAAVAPRRPQRHLVLNTVITDWNDHEAHATSDVIFIQMGKDGGWGIRLVGRYQDVLRCETGQWQFQHRAATFVTPDPPQG
jgi:hypothetical protein